MCFRSSRLISRLIEVYGLKLIPSKLLRPSHEDLAMVGQKSMKERRTRASSPNSKKSRRALRTGVLQERQGFLKPPTHDHVLPTTSTLLSSLDSCLPAAGFHPQRICRACRTFAQPASHETDRSPVRPQSTEQFGSARLQRCPSFCGNSHLLFEASAASDGVRVDWPQVLHILKEQRA